MRRGERRSLSDARRRGCPKTFLEFASTCLEEKEVPLNVIFGTDYILAHLSAFINMAALAVSCWDQLPTYFLSLLSELDVLAALDGDRATSSVSHVLCLLLPYKALGAELLNWAEVGVVVAARRGRAFSALGVLYPWGVYALMGQAEDKTHKTQVGTCNAWWHMATLRRSHRFWNILLISHKSITPPVSHRGLKASILSALEPGGGNVLVR